MGETQACRIHQGWYVVLCFFVGCVARMWLIKGLGVMLPTLQKQLASQAWLVGWMISIITAFICVAGILARPLEVMFGTRTVVTVSGFMLGVSMIIASFSTSIVMLTSILALAAGLALGVTHILLRALTGRCFATSFATAAAIGQSGSSVGIITAGPLVQLLLDTYGWRGALLILGGLSLHLGVCGALLRAPSSDQSKINGSYQSVETDTNEEPQVGSSGADKTASLKQSSRLSAFRVALAPLMNNFGFSVCFQVSFWITAVIFVCCRFVVEQWFIYYVSQAEAKGFSPYEAVTFTTAGGVGNAVLKLLCCHAVDRGLLKLRPVMVLLIVLSSMALLITPLVNTYWLMMANAFLFYGGCGAAGSLNDLYTRELLGTDILASAFAWMELGVAIFSFSLGFFPGWLYDQTGSFDWSFFIWGCILALSLVAFLVEWVLARRKSQ